MHLIQTRLEAGWHWSPVRGAIGRGAMVHAPHMETDWDWILYDVAVYSHDEKYVPMIYRLGHVSLIKAFLTTPHDDDDCSMHVFRYYLQDYLARYMDGWGGYANDQNEINITPQLPILIHPSQLVQLTRCELKCPTVYVLFEGFATKHAGPRILCPTITPMSQRSTQWEADIRLGIPYSVNMRAHQGYFVSPTGHISFHHLRARTWEERFWRDCVYYFQHGTFKGWQEALHQELQPRAFEDVETVIFVSGGLAQTLRPDHYTRGSSRETEVDRK